MPKHIRAAIGAAILTFIAGFGVMSVLYITGSWPAGVRGLYSFKSATYGDALLIPLLIAILVNTYLSLPRRGHDRQILLIAAIPGICIGVIIQWLWLHSSHPALNWTLPDPHTFNYAGWYHAAFLTVICGFLSSILIGILVDLRGLTRTNQSDFYRLARSPWVVILAASAVTFVILLYEDNATSAHAPLTAGTFVSIFISVFLVILLSGLFLSRFALMLGRNLYVGTVGAVGVAACAILIPKYGFAWYELGLAVLIAISGSVMTRSDVKPALVGLSMCAMFGYVMLALTLPRYRSSLTYVGDILVLTILAASVPIAQARSGRQLWSWLKCAIAPEVVAICYLVTRWFFQSGGRGVSIGVGAVLGALVLGIANHVKRDFAAITRAERRPGNDEIRMRQLWLRSWGHFLGLIIAGVPIVAYFTVTGPTGGVSPSHNSTVADFRLVLVSSSASLVCVVAAVVVVLSTSQGRRLIRRRRFEDVGGPIRSGRRYLSQLLVLVGVALQGTVCIAVVVKHFTYAHLPVTVISAVISLLLALWILESVIANMRFLQGQPTDMFTRIAGLLVASNAGIVSFYVMTFGIISSNHGPLPLSTAAQSLILLLQVVILCTLTSVVALGSAPTPSRNTQYPEYFGVLQDEFLASALVILAGLLPIYVWSELGLSVHSALNVFGYCVPLLVPFGLLFYMAIEENRKHLRAEASRTNALSASDLSAEAAGRRKLIEPLSVHVKFQNLFALILVIFTVVPLATLANRDNPVTEYWNVVRQTLF
jgi:hypothetical protein